MQRVESGESGLFDISIITTIIIIIIMNFCKLKMDNGAEGICLLLLRPANSLSMGTRTLGSHSLQSKCHIWFGVTCLIFMIQGWYLEYLIN